MTIDTQAIKQSVDLISLIGSRVKLKKSGSTWKGLCPFHGERTPSFTIWPSTGNWKCFGCQESGDAIAFLMKADGLTFIEACEALDRGTVVARIMRPEPRPVRVVDPRPLLAALWDIVREAPWSPTVYRYLTGRAIDPDAPWKLGCRDWSSVAREVRQLVRSAHKDLIITAGLGNNEHLWAGINYLGDPRWSGIYVPVWRQGEAFPWRWRLRFCRLPFDDASKSFSSFSNGWAPTFVGAETPDVGKRWSKTLLVVEGEPDWWSAVDVLGDSTTVVGICGSFIEWQPGWPSFEAMKARGVERIAVCVHEGSDSEQHGPHGRLLANDIALCAGEGGMDVVARLPPEGFDLNDIHQAGPGKLRSWLSMVLK